MTAKPMTRPREAAPRAAVAAGRRRAAPSAAAPSKLDRSWRCSAAARGREPRRADRRDRLAGALGARRARRQPEAEGSRHPVREDRRRAPLPDRSRAMIAATEIAERSSAWSARPRRPAGRSGASASAPRSRLRSPELLRLLLAWRMQAAALGGLDPETRRRLRLRGRVQAEGLELGVGARLRRDWRGRPSRWWSRRTASAGRTGSTRASRRWRRRSPARAGTARGSSACGGQRHERPSRRCAIYTRKSSEEGLEQDFNSLDAQREACEAYVRARPARAGGRCPPATTTAASPAASMERPGLQRLLADIDAGKVDVVVVYKVDRLTRSLADFAQHRRALRPPRRQLRLRHPAVQHHHQHGPADAQRAAVLRPVRARGHRRAHPRQDRRLQGARACGWAARCRSATTCRPRAGGRWCG